MKTFFHPPAIIPSQAIIPRATRRITTGIGRAIRATAPHAGRIVTSAILEGNTSQPLPWIATLIHFEQGSFSRNGDPEDLRGKSVDQIDALDMQNMMGGMMSTKPDIKALDRAGPLK